MALAGGKLIFQPGQHSCFFPPLTGNIISHMKKIIFPAIAYCIVMFSCQKSPIDLSVDNGTGNGNGTGGVDSVISAGDTITYEVLTADATGWAGIWNEPDGTIGYNPLDSGTFGSPVYY